MAKSKQDQEIEALIAENNKLLEEGEGLSAMEKVLMRMAAVLEKIQPGQPGQIPDATSQIALDKLSVSLERFAEAQQETAREMKRGTRPSNEVVPMRSVFNLRGNLLAEEADPAKRYEKPKLVCEMFIPWTAENESLTREEVELLNILVQMPGEYLLKRIDNTKIRITVKVDTDVSGKRPSRLTVAHETAFNNDNHRLMPPLVDWLRFVIRQADDAQIRAAANDVVDMETEELMIERGELSVSH